MENIQYAIVSIQKQKADLEEAFQIIQEDKPANGPTGFARMTDSWVRMYPTSFGYIYVCNDTVLLIEVLNPEKFDPERVAVGQYSLKDNFKEKGVYKITVGC